MYIGGRGKAPGKFSFYFSIKIKPHMLNSDNLTVGSASYLWMNSCCGVWKMRCHHHAIIVNRNEGRKWMKPWWTRNGDWWSRPKVMEQWASVCSIKAVHSYAAAGLWTEAKRGQADFLGHGSQILYVCGCVFPCIYWFFGRWSQILYVLIAPQGRCLMCTNINAIRLPLVWKAVTTRAHPFAAHLL